ncbi:MAG TPA: hypothetical protein VFY12_06895 [Arenimonas sp.]|nr:hypothetical protein [Arenimonas sp.]
MPRLLLLLLALLPTAVQAARWSEPEMVGVLAERAISEVSGLTASRRHPGVYWAHNDSGHPAELHAIDAEGKRLATLRIPVKAIDWEDIASFEWQGRPYLLLADVGDNGGIRAELQLIAIAEPEQLVDGMELQPAWIQRFRWPDGPRDCEAVAVDSRRGEVLLISKKRVPPELFRLPLGPTDEPQAAELLGNLLGIDQPSDTDLEKNPVYGRYRSQITAADLSPNGRVLAVLNYSGLQFYVRPAGADWRDLLPTLEPSRIALPWLPQAEALAFEADSSGLLVASEQTPSPILRYRVLRDPP